MLVHVVSVRISELDLAQSRSCYFWSPKSDETLPWCCDNYVNSIPCLHKLLIRVRNVEAKYENLEERVHPLEVEKISKDSAKAMVKGELSEQKRLNVMSFRYLKVRRKVLQSNRMKIKAS